MLLRIAVVAAALALAGCAEKVLVRSDPSGADVYFQDRVVGQTPMVLAVQRGDLRPQMPIRLEKSGYAPADVVLQMRVSPGRLITSIILTGGIALAFKGPQDIRPFKPVPLELRAQLSTGPEAVNADTAARLRKLEEMRSARAITEAEYAQMRAEVLRAELKLGR